MDENKRGYLSMSQDIHLSKKISPKTSKERNRMTSIPYASAVGSIIYAMLCIRPNVAYAFEIVNRFQANPDKDHWKAIKNILKYLRRTKNIFLVSGGSNLKLKGYSNSSFQSDLDDSKSTLGYIFTLNDGALS